jgi:hypothetical protein
VLQRVVMSFLHTVQQPANRPCGRRALMGMLIVVYALGREILPAVGAGFPEPEHYGGQLTAIFLDGLSATPRQAGVRSESLLP